jgi:hypothetical protein
MSVQKTCPCCGGTGRVPLSGEYARTLALLRTQKQPAHGAALAWLDGCRNEAMCNRLRVLETFGLAKGERVGRRVLWAVTLMGAE